MEKFKLIKDIRNELGMSQNEFAEKLEISRSVLALIETGRNKLSLDIYGKVFEVFGVDLMNKTHFKNNVSNDNLKDNRVDNPIKIQRAVLNEMYINAMEQNEILQFFVTILKLNNYKFSSSEKKQLDLCRRIANDMFAIQFDDEVLENDIEYYKNDIKNVINKAINRYMKECINILKINELVELHKL